MKKVRVFSIILTIALMITMSNTIAFATTNPTDKYTHEAIVNSYSESIFKENLFTYEKLNDGWQIVECESSADEVTIPGAVIGKAVLSIKPYTFLNCEQLSEIKVSPVNNYYTSVDGVLFTKDMKTLVAYPKNKDCTNYTVPYGVRTIGDGAFANCQKLQIITLPETIEVLGKSAFFNCTSLKNINTPDSITSILGSTFNNCTNLESFSFPEQLDILMSSSFTGCSNLKDFSIPASVAKCYLGLHLQGSAAYDNPDNQYENALYIDDVLISFNDNSVDEYAVKENTKAISYLSFDCEELKNISIPEGVEVIGGAAFHFCPKLESVTIPSSVTYIGERLFNSENTTVTIYGYENSYAENYAKEYDINFVSIGNAYKSGDVNADGVINIKDATQIQKSIANLTTFTDTQAILADYNSDGQINIKDATEIQKHLAGLKTSDGIGKKAG